LNNKTALFKQIQQNPNIAPPSLSTCERPWTQIPHSKVFQFTTTNFTEHTVVLYWNLVALQYAEGRGMKFVLMWLQEAYLNFTWTWDSYPRVYQWIWWCSSAVFTFVCNVT